MAARIVVDVKTFPDSRGNIVSTETRRSMPAADIIPFPETTRPIRNRKRADRKQQRLFQTILSNMSQGVLLFDSDARLVFCNPRYIEMYGLSPEVVRPGSSLLALLLTTVRRFERYPSPPDNHSKNPGPEWDKETPPSPPQMSGRGRFFQLANTPLAGGGGPPPQETTPAAVCAKGPFPPWRRHF